MFIALHTLEPNMIWSSVVVLKFKMVISSGEFLFFGLIGREKGKKWQKLCLLCFVSQEPYIIWSSFMVHMCKRIISPKVFFHFLKILVYWVNYFVSVVKGQKMAQSDKKDICSTPYLRKHTSLWSWFLVQKTSILWFVRGKEGTKWHKMTKTSVLLTLCLKKCTSYHCGFTYV